MKKKIIKAKKIKVWAVFENKEKSKLQGVNGVDYLAVFKTRELARHFAINKDLIVRAEIKILK